MKRQRLEKTEGKTTGGGLYFAAPKSSIHFIKTGCVVLDCVLGGGWPLGRVSNIVGDKSTGKTLLAIEASSNFARQYDGKVFYRETESAFDPEYAAALGMPLDRVNFGPKTKGKTQRWRTVEEIFEDLYEKTREHKNSAGLYVVDSLDALSDTAELDRGFDEATFGGSKPKQIGALFRRLVQDIEESQLHFMVVSQVRDNIGVMFGEKHKRSGGRALDFYASQALWLANLGQLHQTIRGVKRTVGVKIKANCKKNKISLPYRTCEFPIEFGFGVDDVTASVNWLADVKRLGEAELGKGEDAKKAFLSEVRGMSSQDYKAERIRLAKVVRRVWREIETDFLPTRTKY